jgi:hypothetical protein
MYGVEQVAKRREGVDRDQGQTERELRTGVIKHPRRQRTERVI